MIFFQWCGSQGTATPTTFRWFFSHPYSATHTKLLQSIAMSF